LAFIVSDNSGNRDETVERRGRQPQQQSTPATLAAVTIFPGGASWGTRHPAGTHHFRKNRSKYKTAVAYHKKLREISPWAPQRAMPNSRSDSRFKARWRIGPSCPPYASSQSSDSPTLRNEATQYCQQWKSRRTDYLCLHGKEGAVTSLIYLWIQSRIRAV